MKTKEITKSLLVTVFALIFNFGFGQTSDIVVITLTADTSELGNDRKNPGGCSLSAVPASVIIINDGKPENFTIEVDNGTEIEWVGKTAQGDEFDIKHIKYKKGMNIFNRMTLKGKRSNGKDRVKGNIKRKTPQKMDYSYEIKFFIKRFGRYFLDPKIRVK